MAQSTAKGMSATTHNKVRKSPTALDEIKLGRQKKTRMPSLMPYSSAQPDPGSNMHTHRLRVGSSSWSAARVPLPPPPLSHVASSSRPMSMPRPEKRCCAVE
eukprot:jgi/Chrpa1/5184/Chrysochromulina_OHIO_Genome00012186-RA